MKERLRVQGCCGSGAESMWKRQGMKRRTGVTGRCAGETGMSLGLSELCLVTSSRSVLSFNAASLMV